MKKILFITIAFLSMVSANAQQDAMFTHYMYNTLAINPAYAGSRDALTVTALHRSQWVGFDGAPVTQTLTMHTPIFNNKIGLGLSVLNDKIGPVNNTSINADFAYKIHLSNKGILAFGLKGGINIMQGDLTSLELDQTGDEAFSQDIESDLLPNFGFGVYYSTEKWYVGFSTPKLLENDFETSSSQGGTKLASEQRHYFLIAGTVFNLDQTGNLKLAPTTFVKVTNGAPIQADLTAMFILKDKIEMGAMYRTSDAAGLLLGYNFTEYLRLGYSFDWSFENSTADYNSGSHEIMLRYDFVFKDKSKIRSPRYF